MTNRDLHEQLLGLLESGYTVLAETERFVHQIQREFRLRRTSEGKAGWESPKIHTLNRWLDSFWAESWPEQFPASSLMRWKTLLECVEELPPPEPLPADFGLIQMLDESFEQCLRYGMDPGGGEAANRLIEWRREVFRSFDERLSRAGLFHPARLPQKILETLDARRSSFPVKMAFVGFEFAGHWEKFLLKELHRRAGAIFYALPAAEAKPAALVYSDPEQEIAGLMENLLIAANRCAPHEIAVVLLDSDFYSPAISSLLRDLLGEPLSGESAAYNLCPDRDLSGQPFFNAALLPVRFALGGQLRRDLFSLLRSPYYGFFSSRGRRLALLDRTWREKGIERGMDSLLDAVRAAKIFPHGGEEIRAAVSPFLHRGGKTVSSWVADLRRTWTQFGFPVLANELDQICRQNLSALLDELESGFGGTTLGPSDFVELMSSAAARTRIQKTGLEDAGIQLLSRLDARGLVFGKIFVPGFVSGALPQPVRSLPMLSTTERKKVLGGTLESQLSFARYIYGNLCAAAPEIVLSRPTMGKNSEICLPSPFWTQEGEKKIDPVIPWKDRLPAMQRARWVQQSISGTGAFGPSGPGETDSACAGSADFIVAPITLVEPISVSELQSALLCPAQYFFRHILGLNELDEFEPGIPPLERGRKIHAILASFVVRAIAAQKVEHPPSLKGGWGNFAGEELVALLKETAADVLGPLLRETAWQVEFERLIGKPDYPGLLIKWLDEELKRIYEGWSWLAVESRFVCMELEGCPAFLKGRLDRIDSHPEQGLVCWDYKTGTSPGRKEVIEENTQPQLPAYLLALLKGSVCGVHLADAGGGAGYIEMISPGKTGHLLLFDPAAENRPTLLEWEKKAAAAINAILAGDISPRWLKDNQACEQRCAYKGICGSP